MTGAGKSLLSIKKNHGKVLYRMTFFNSFSRSRTGGRGDQFKCIDDNECVNGNNYCVDAEKGGICVNIDGSFTCTCQTGYTGDGNDYQKWRKLTQSGPVIKKFRCYFPIKTYIIFILDALKFKIEVISMSYQFRIPIT